MPLLSTTSLALRPDALLTGAFALIYLAVAVYATAIPQGRRNWWGLAALMALLVIAGLQVQAPAPRMALLDLAALSAVGMVWVQPERGARRAALAYLVALAAGMLAVWGGMALAGLLSGGPVAAPAQPVERLVVALLVTGFALKLALVPFYFWLPGVAGVSRPMTTALIVGTLDMAELGELLTLRESAPWVFTAHAGLWLALALLSMFGGALLALSQRDLKRMLAFSTIDDMGYLVLGVLSGPGIGLGGAMLGMLSHALCKVLLFGAVGVAEQGIGEPVTLDCRGLATRFPVSGAMFIAGALGLIGVPPLGGFAGRYRLYLAGFQMGGIALILAMALATALALIYYVRAIHDVWLGRLPGRVDSSRPAEPRRATAALIVLALAVLALGLFPGLLQGAL